MANSSECNDPDVTRQSDLKTDDTTTEIADKPRNVSLKAWQRFQALEKRANTVTKRSTEKRIQILKKSVLEKVQNELTSDEDKDILREHDVSFGPPLKKSEREAVPVTEPAAKQKKASSSGNTEAWQEVKQLLDVNKHLEQSTPSSSTAQSGLEVKVNEAIKRGDVHTAEVLSDRLAVREFGVKIAEAVSARDFLKRKKEEEKQQNERKKKKLNWGFEHKQRWEAKGNM